MNLAAETERPGVKARLTYTGSLPTTTKVLETIRAVAYPDSPYVGAILRPVDAKAIIEHAGGRLTVLSLIEKLIDLMHLPDDGLTGFSCDEMRAIQEAVLKADRGEW